MIRVGGAVPHFLNGWASDLQTREPITFGLCGFEPRPGWKLPASIRLIVRFPPACEAAVYMHMQHAMRVSAMGSRRIGPETAPPSPNVGARATTAPEAPQASLSIEAVVCSKIMLHHTNP